jgi:hypothetical protein
MLLDQLHSYKLDVTAIQEMRWIGEGVTEKKDCTVFYSCHGKQHMFGTGFVVSKRVKHLIMDFKAKSPRLCRLQIRGHFFNYSIICAHAPIEEKNEEENDSFYEDLDRLYDDCPRRDFKIILGNMNAKVGKEDGHKPTIGKHSLHDESNDNGIRLINSASARNIVIGSTMFEHRDIHKVTWRSLDGNTFNQTDHLLIDARHQYNLMNIKTHRGANVDSDHYLSVSRIRARISNAR